MLTDDKATRRYTRLAASTWAEVRALWEVGDRTLEELSDRFGVSHRTLQNHFKRHGCGKGAKAAAVAAAVMKKVFEEELGDPELKLKRAKDARESAHNNAVVIERRLMEAVASAKLDHPPTVVKMLGNAAAALSRLHDLKFRALGLDGDADQGGDLPVLEFVDLTNPELEEIRRGQEEDDLGFEFEDEGLALAALSAGADDRYDDEGVIEEGFEPINPTHEGEINAEGERLTRSARRHDCREIA